jgi:predicted permease
VNLPKAGAAPFLYFTYREDGQAFQDVGLWRTDTMSVTGVAEPEEVPSLHVSDGVLPILGIAPLVGRAFSKTDDTPAGVETVMLAAGYWRARLGADPSVVGRLITLDGKPREIIGVMPDSFRFLDRKVSLILPLRNDRSKTLLGNFSYSLIARLKPGVSIERAQADATRLIPVSLAKFPPPPGFSLKMFEEARLAPIVRSLKSDVVGNVQTVLWVLMGTIGLVLLVACANVANLLLVRAESRQQELAIRAALGAGWGQIARELLLESLTLGVAGGIAGLGVAFGALRVLKALAPGNLPRLDDIAIDAPVLLFTLGISLVAGVLFGAIPILKYAGPNLNTALRGGGRTASASRERHRARNTLVIAQLALALVLLVGSGLMIRTFRALGRVQPGFSRPEQVQTLRISIPESHVKEAADLVRTQQAVAEKIATLGGVRSVALTSVLPMDGDDWHDPIFAEDRSYAPSQIPPIRLFKFVSPGLLATMGNSLVAGRDFTWVDVHERRPVAIVSENLARELWQNPQAALGKRIRENSMSAWREIVGVVGDERDDGVDHPAPAMVLWPMFMTNFEGSESFVRRSLAFVVRSERAGSHGFVDEIAQAVWSIDPNLPLANVRTLREVYDRSLARTSFTLVMLAIAGGMALVLGVAGIYGVIAYSVTERTREIGIRIALGARAGEVTRMFVRHGLLLSAVGVSIGLAAAWVASRVMSSLLFEVSPVDPLTYAAVSCTLVIATLVASYVPAVRATAVDPVEALRAE